ncbi:MAG: 5-formyltetrahydrofolate cyclo-ligase [Azoarcus sp.]|jgi:5,10-methenyltetrahydrofolate synthetase|nr:5-formyltetrahydrofolate cyclo-ligase [Azoarcus sp.]
MHSSSDEVHARRAAMRARALAARECTPAACRALWEEAIARHLDTLIGWLAPRVLAFYWPFRAEADLRGWAGRWLAGDAARIAALPMAAARNAPLVFRGWSPGMELARDRHGIPCPAHGKEVVPEVVLVPLNAFDACGYRLGYGGGYFDRTLAAMRVLAVGVGFELGRETDVLPQPHDRGMDWLVTEAGAAPAARRREAASGLRNPEEKDG